MNKQLITTLTLLLLFNFSFSKTSQFKLKNGLTVIVDEDHSSNSCAGVLVVKAGSKNDPDNHTGIAHYFEHMLFKGSDKIGAINWAKEKPLLDSIANLYDKLSITKNENQQKEYIKKINQLSKEAGKYANDAEFMNLAKEIGGDKFNAGTSYDFTIFYSSFNKSQLKKWLNLYSTVFRTPSLRAFQAELEVVYEEKNLYNDNIMAYTGQQLIKKIFKNHPYGQKPILGTIEHLKKPSISETRKFFDKYYVPNNMALVLTGNFTKEEVEKYVEDSFGKWKYKNLEKFKEYPEKDFKGREYEELDIGYFNLLEAGLMVYRTVPEKHPDNLKLEVCQRILSNTNRSGLIDKMTTEDKVLFSALLPLKFNDHGVAGIVYVSNFTLFFSNFEDDEKAILAQLDKLKFGDFEENLLEAAKNDIIKNYHLNKEEQFDRIKKIATLFTQNISIKEYEQRIMDLEKISKRDIMEVAKKYFNKNYQITEIGIGFPFKSGGEQIEKPEIVPIKFNTEDKSNYAKSFKKIETIESKPMFVDFEKDVEFFKLNKGIEVYKVENSLNNIFEITLDIASDEADYLNLDLIAKLMSYAHTPNLNLGQVKDKLFELGSDFNYSFKENVFTIRIRGFEKNYKETIDLLASILNNPIISESKLEKLVDSESIVRGFEQGDAGVLSSALLEYLSYGNKSSFINRLTMDEIEDFKLEIIPHIINNNLKLSPVTIHLSGNIQEQELNNLVDKLELKPLFEKRDYYGRLSKKYEKPKLYFVDNPDMLQSKIVGYIKGEAYDYEKEYLIDTYNNYFGSGFSSILFEEIRKKRSMAYNISGKYKAPLHPKNNYNFNLMFFTQADKTNEAINLLNSLINDIPQNKSKFESVKEFLIQSSNVKRPNFRYLSHYVENAKLMGYRIDPANYKIEQYSSITLNQIINFHNKKVKDKNLILGLVADKSKIDFEFLEAKYNVIELEKEELFSE